MDVLDKELGDEHSGHVSHHAPGMEASGSSVEGELALLELLFAKARVSLLP